MKKVIYFVPYHFSHASNGNTRAQWDMLRAIVDCRCFEVTVCVIGSGEDKDRLPYEKIGCKFVSVPLKPHWGFWSILNMLFSRILPCGFICFGNALGYRRQVMEVAKQADWFLMTYSWWWPLLSKRVLREKTIVLTHDILFYRLASVYGVNTLRKRWRLFWNKKSEAWALNKFNRVGVFGEYEKKVIVDAGVCLERVIVTGMPIRVEKRIPVPDEQVIYDFMFIGGNGYPNYSSVLNFFERVVPLLPTNREIKVALVGRCATVPAVINYPLPSHIKLELVGFVDDTSLYFAKSRIGIGTVKCGSGVKVKVVEMTLHGLPVVVANSGAEGIPLSGPGVVNIDTQSAEEVRSRLSRWLNSVADARADGEATSKIVSREFAPDGMYSRLTKYIGKGC